MIHPHDFSDPPPPHTHTSDAYFYIYYIVRTEILILNNCHKTNKRALCRKIQSRKKKKPLPRLLPH